MKKLPSEFIVKCNEDSEKCRKVYSNFYNDDEFEPSCWKYIVCSPEIKKAQFKKSGKYPPHWCIENLIRDEFKHLPVLSYEEWEDSVSWEKKIVGYKLNELGCNNLEAISVIVEEYFHALKVMWESFTKKSEPLFHVGSQIENRLKKAGVLDLWFEPVYKEEESEFKVGDLVVAVIQMSTGDVRYIGKYIDENTLSDWGLLNEEGRGFKNGGRFSKIERHATLEEIKTTLLAEAKRRYPVGTKYICPTNKTEEVVTKQHFKIQDIDEEIIHGEPGRGCLMFHGKWAAIITEPSQPKLTKKQIKKEIKSLLKEL